jgi:hypothetical protein
MGMLMFAAFDHLAYEARIEHDILFSVPVFDFEVRGGVVVEALCYKPEGRGFVI